jgi:hypothetical protein
MGSLFPLCFYLPSQITYEELLKDIIIPTISGTIKTRYTLTQCRIKGQDLKTLQITWDQFQFLQWTDVRYDS